MAKPEVSLTVQIEALLFVANEPLSVKRLTELTGATEENIVAVLAALKVQLARQGWRLSDLHHEYQLVTAPETDEIVRRYLEAESRGELSKAALETLAIIAYRGPLTRTVLEDIRGVASDTMLRNLLQRGLIQEAGAAPEPGRPMRYSVSHGFLQHLGLDSLDALPPLPEADPS